MGTKRKSRLSVVRDIPEGSLLLSAEDTENLKIQVALTMHHRQILAQLEAQVCDHIESTYGVSVRAGGGWSLNTAEGRLDRVG